MKELFSGIFFHEKKILTKNLVPGKTVYGENLLKVKGQEFRVWNPFRSKLAAAIKNGLTQVPLQKGNTVLYLGSAEGTTVSHVSDIVGEKGVVFSVDVSERVMRKFLEICKQRKNLVPILADANKPESYADYLKGQKIDLLYQDVAQKNQAEIFLKNAKAFLPKEKFGLIAVKARSISQRNKAMKIVEMETNKLMEEFKVLQLVNLKPFEKDHFMVLCKKK